jgi:RHS repeat-associated protein
MAFTDTFLGPGDSIIGIASSSPTETFYYTNQWQVIQDDLQSSPTSTPVIQDQYVWGEAYVNELVLRDTNTGATGNLGVTGSGLSQRLYALQDANWDVVALVSPGGSVQERFTYDPYGNVTVLGGGWSAASDVYNWQYLYQGGRVNTLTGLYTFQHRNYSPVLGTWVEEDPAGYTNGGNLYEFLGGDPLALLDPTGERYIAFGIDGFIDGRNGPWVSEPGNVINN